MKLFYYLFFQLVIIFGFAQEVEVLNRSNFKHDYFVTNLQYIEELKDTAGIQFMASIRVSGDHQNLIINQWYNILNARAKELGANLYYIENYSEIEGNAILNVKLYFAGINFLRTNKIKNNKNTIYVFNQSRSKNDTAFFYLNQKKIEFDPKKYYAVTTKPYQLYNIGMTSKKSSKQNHSFPRDAASVFYILPSNKKSLVITNVTNAQNGINFSIGKNKPFQCDYDLGRFLIEVYK